jgi:hypothetical protein
MCKSGIFSHHIISFEKLCLSLELFIINYSNKKYIKENTLSYCTVFFFTSKNHLFQKEVCRFLK